MKEIIINEITKKKDYKKFIKFGHKIYKNHDYWVSPIDSELLKTLIGKSNPLFKAGPHITLLALCDGKIVGRMIVGIDIHDNEKNKINSGYFSLFECIDDQEVANALFKYAKTWLKKHGMDSIKGPVSPNKGDDYKGLLIEGFDELPALLNSYNHEYYINLLEKQGFKKGIEDQLSYYFDIINFPHERYEKVITYAKRKFGYNIKPVNIKNIEQEVTDLHQILTKAINKERGMTVPTPQDIVDEYKNLKLFINPNLIYVARKNETNEPIGFVASLPDYNQVLKIMGGRLLPFGWLKFLLNRSKITRIRAFAQMVIPEYQGLGINSAIFFELFKYAKLNGYNGADGSTIGEDNAQSRKSVEDIGGVIYRRFRIYTKPL